MVKLTEKGRKEWQENMQNCLDDMIHYSYIQCFSCAHRIEKLEKGQRRCACGSNRLFRIYPCDIALNKEGFYTTKIEKVNTEELGNTDGEIISYKEATRTAKSEELEKRVERLENIIKELVQINELVLINEYKRRSDCFCPTDVEIKYINLIKKIEEDFQIKRRNNVPN